MQKLLRGISSLLHRSGGNGTGSKEPKSGATSRLIKKRDKVDYIADLLDQIPLKCVRMTEVRTCPDACFYIRHDVDHDIVRALDMAAAEQRCGYRSTYFLLPPGSYGEKTNYYGTLRNGRVEYADDLIDRCRQLIDLGHDVGYHSDLVAMSLMTGQSARALLQRDLDFFRRHKIELVGTASHGSELPRALHYNNRELFKGCKRKGWEVGRTIRHNGSEVQLHSLELEEFGFQFEAYSLPRDSRISESGGTWAGKLAGVRIDQHKFRHEFNLDEFRGLFAPLRQPGAVKALSILAHPCHWNLS